MHAQDYIVPASNDTIYCKITRISDSYLHYSVESEVGTTRTRIKQENVQTFFQAVPFVEEEPEPVEEEYNPHIITQEPGVELPPDVKLRQFGGGDRESFRIGLQGQFGYQFAGYEGSEKAYTKQVRTLWGFGAEAHYFLNRGLGFGIRYNRISTPASGENIVANGVSLNQLDEQITFTYTAVSMLNRRDGFGKNDKTYYGVSVGFVKYHNEGSINLTPFYEEGRTLAIALDGGYDYAITSKFGIGIGASLNIARLSEIDTNTGTAFGSFDVSRFDITFGVRYYR